MSLGGGRVETIGYHYVVEASGCDAQILADSNAVRDILLEAARVGGMEVRTSHFYRFAPSGVSGVVIVAESHLTIHSWPERGYAALDVYVCGENANPEKAIEHLLARFDAAHAHISEVKRGIQDDNEYTHTIMTWEVEP